MQSAQDVIEAGTVFVSFRPDDTAIVKVLDFGISKSATGADLSLTQTSSMLGTPAYMSPEQMRSARTVDARTDIWSIGTVLYELVEARRPFDAESFSEMCVMVAVDSPSPMLHAPELEPIILRCLAKTPDQRYANVPELMRALAAFAGNPDAARHFIIRAYRVLGLPVPRNLESSPSIRAVATYQTPMPAMPLSAIMPARTAASTVSTTIGHPPRTSRSAVTVVLLLCLLLGVAGAVAYVKLTGQSPTTAAGLQTEATGSVQAERSTAGAGSNAGAGADSIGSGSVAGSGAAGSRSGSGAGSTTIARGGGKPAHGGARLPKGGGKPPKGGGPRSTDAGKGSAAPNVTKPKCDPFNSVRGC